MRKPRLKVPSTLQPGWYHCVSRVVDRQYLLDDDAKELFVSLMREYEAFCGVHILTYCILSNHFHILLEVPERPVEGLPEAEILRRLEGLSGMNQSGTIRQGFEALRESPAAYEAFRQKILGRMWDVSAFMKLLKQRFTQTFNRRHGRKGTLWEERFRSVLVDGAGQALATMAAYIDLNPVRAGLVDDPKDYRWCGYAAAVARGRGRGYVTVLRGLGQGELSQTKALEVYRQWLFEQGLEDEGVREDGMPMRRGFDREQVLAVVAAKGRLPLRDYLRLRVRYFVDGAVLGSRGFVDEIFARYRERFGPKRRTGARRLRGFAGDLYALRGLRVGVFGTGEVSPHRDG